MAHPLEGDGDADDRRSGEFHDAHAPAFAKALAHLDNVTLSSHAGFRTVEASMTLMRRAIDIVRTITANAA